MKIHVKVSIAGIILLLTGLLYQGTNADTTVLLRKPYVQNLQPTALTIVWTTAEAGESYVAYGVGSLGKTAVSTTTLLTTPDAPPYDAYYVHETTLTNLTPDTLYQYRIFTNGENLTPHGIATVRSGKPASATTFRFAAIGDSRKENLGRNGVVERLQQIQPDLILHAGDYAYPRASYAYLEERFFQVYDDLLSSVWIAPAIGNHDMDYLGGQSFVDVFVNPSNGAADPLEAEMYYSFDYANAHFTVLAGDLPYEAGSHQYAWLDNDLANSQQPWKFVVLHPAPYYTNISQTLKINSSLTNSLVPLFEAHDVDVVISGDINFYERLKPMREGGLASFDEGGILYLMTGGGGAGLRQIGDAPWHPLTANKQMAHHLVMFDVNDCKLTLTAVSGDTDTFNASDVFDTLTINHCHQQPTADFVADIVSGSAPLTVNFSDLSSGNPASWQWHFGDGQNGWQQGATHTYTQPGIYSVELTVHNPHGSHTRTRPAYITVTEPPPTQFRLAEAYYDIGESGSPTVTVAVEATWPSTTAQTISYTTQPGTATPHSDYQPISGTLTFAPGETRHLLELAIVDDAVAEPMETFTLALSGADVAQPNVATVAIFDDDGEPGVRFAQSHYPALEDSGDVTVTVSLTQPYTQTVTVDFAAVENSATIADFQPVADTLTFAPGSTSQSFRVPLMADSVIETDETVDLVLRNPVGAVLASPETAVLLIQNDDHLPQVQFEAVSETVDETAGLVYVIVRLTKPFYEPVQVGYETVDENAAAGLDYVMRQGTLTFAPGQISQAFTVPILDDSLIEPLESIRLRLLNPNNATLGNPRTAVLHISDDDNLPQFHLSADAVQVAEGSGYVTLEVVLEQAAYQTTLVDYELVGQTAVNNEDFVGGSGTLAFVAGKSRQSITIPIIDDQLDEPPETMQLLLRRPRGGLLAAPSSATVTILDDDKPPQVQFASPTYAGLEGSEVVLTVMLEAPSGTPVTVDYVTMGGTAVSQDYTPSAGTLTFAPGETVQTITIPLTADGVQEGDETLFVALVNAVNSSLGIPNPAQVTIWDADAPPTIRFEQAAYTVTEGSPTAIIPVLLTGNSDKVVTVSFFTVAQSASSGLDYAETSGMLTFPPGTQVQHARVPIFDDQLDEEPETVLLVLNDWQNAQPGSLITAELTLLDDDNAPLVAFSAPSFIGSEAEGEGKVAIGLQQPSAKPVTVTLTTSGGTATPLQDYLPITGTVTVPPGELFGYFAVPLLNDAVDEPDETVQVSLIEVENGRFTTPTTAQLTIADDDTPPTLGFGATEITVLETAPTAVLTVALTAVSEQLVQVHYATRGQTATQGGDFAAASGTIWFYPGEISHTLTIPLFDDALAEPDEQFVVELTAPSHATVGGTGQATVTIVDDDSQPLLSWSAASYEVDEGEQEAVLTVQLSWPAEQPVTVHVATEDGTASSGLDYVAVSQQLTLMPGEQTKTIRIPLRRDTLSEGDETVLVTLDGLVNAKWGGEETAVLTIHDSAQYVLFLPVVRGD